MDSLFIPDHLLAFASGQDMQPDTQGTPLLPHAPLPTDQPSHDYAFSHC